MSAHVLRPRVDLAATAIETEGPPAHDRVQDRLVDEMIFAVPAAHLLKARYLQVGEKISIEGADLLAAAQRLAGPTRDIVLGIGVNPSAMACRLPAISALKCSWTSSSIRARDDAVMFP